MSKVTNLLLYDNPKYSHGKSGIFRILWILSSRMFFQTPIPFPYRFKCWLLKMFGAKTGHSVIIKPNVTIKHPWMLEIGDHSWIGENVWIDNLVFVRVKNNVCLSQGALLLTGNHNYKKTSFDLITGEILLEDGAWIGAKSTVCPGVTCFSHSVLTVGSIATKNLEAYKVYQGNPAVAVKTRKIN